MRKHGTLFDFISTTKKLLPSLQQPSEDVSRSSGNSSISSVTLKMIESLPQVYPANVKSESKV
jgi:hypothetical protein